MAGLGMAGQGAAWRGEARQGTQWVITRKERFNVYRNNY
jgi:hypothetical protein